MDRFVLIVVLKALTGSDVSNLMYRLLHPEVNI